MSWGTNCNSMNGAKLAVEAEARAGNGWEIVWHKGNAYIYRNKETGRVTHSHFKTITENGETWVKDVYDFRVAEAARKFLSLVKGHEAEYVDRVAEANRLIAHEAEKEKLKGLKSGDRVYIKDYYVLSGWAEFAYFKGRSVIVKALGKLYRMEKDAIDLEKTFGGV